MWEPVPPTSAELAPGERAVLVAKPSAFLYRYGSGPRVIGKFINSSNLSGSERITPTDAPGSILASFIYNNTATNPWPKNRLPPPTTGRISRNGRPTGLAEPRTSRPTPITTAAPT